MVTWAYIFEHPDADPVADRHVLEGGGQRTILVPVPSASDAAEVARGLVAEGVELVELCGGVPLVEAARVVDAVGEQVPVGHVTFAVDSVPGAASVNAAFEAMSSG